ncbi:MAG: trypsin-like peptidase domain-containing protein [Ruminococcus sp.]|nr:trypsin-like peptidase domain-containing protein [Ruminococcus sp.]
MINKFNPDDNHDTFTNETDNLSDIGSVEPQNYENYYGETASSEPYPPDYNSYAFTSENNPKPKKKRKHFLLKSAIFVLCLAVVGVGSIQGYKIYMDNKDKTEVSEFDPEKKRSTDGDDSLEAENLNASNNGSAAEDIPSLIQLASREDAKPIPEIVDEIMPSVVGVASKFEFTEESPYGGFFGWSPEPQTREGSSAGTGFIISEDGYIVTNAHCVYDTSEYQAGKAIEVSVLFSDESEVEANIIAYDIETDIAVLKVNKTGLKPAVIGDSNDLMVGELVIAVGNPLGFDLFGSVTSGIVSALNREISVNERSMSLIQTDAAINSGNSGGPLLNSCGQVIGINSSKMSSSYGMPSVEGLGFAIPISDAKVIIDDLINYQYVTGRPQIGISTNDITETYSRYLNLPMGVYVLSVMPDSAAEKAGILQGDVIIDVDGKAITTAAELNEIISEHKAGDEIVLTVSRYGEDIKITLELQEKKS